MYSDGRVGGPPEDNSARSAAPAQQAGPCAAAAPSPPPVPAPYADEDALLSAIARAAEPIDDLARRFNIRLTLLLDWLADPRTRARLDALLAAHDLALHNQLQSARRLALSALTTLLSESDDPVERRRAATAILRTTARPRSASPAHALHPAHTPHGITGDSLHQLRSQARRPHSAALFSAPVAILGDPGVPLPALTPQQATITILERLQDADNPATGDGLRTLYNFLSPRWLDLLCVRSAEQFVRTPVPGYLQFIAHGSAVLHSTVFPEPYFNPWTHETSPILTATQHFTFTSARGVPFIAAFSFARASVSEPWLIDHIALRPRSPDDDSVLNPADIDNDDEDNADDDNEADDNGQIAGESHDDQVMQVPRGPPDL